MNFKLQLREHYDILIHLVKNILSIIIERIIDSGQWTIDTGIRLAIKSLNHKK